MKSLSNKLRSAERGQAILLIALAMVGLVAFVGLMVDVGVLFMEQGKIKRGIDAGTIAAAQQFRKGFIADDMVLAAEHFLLLNDTAASAIIIYRCKDNDPVDDVEDAATIGDGTVHDATLCTVPRRKLIRVEAQRWVPFSFLRIIGIQGRMISASSVSEAASIDIVLVIDTSASMSYETGGDARYPDHVSDDPAYCNDPANATPCEPLNTVKNVAKDFITTMFFPYDRVAVVAMTSQIPDGTRDHVTVLELSDDESDVDDALDSLKVFQPVVCNWGLDPSGGDPASPEFGPCINRGANTPGNDAYQGLGCPQRNRGADLIANTGDETPDLANPSSCNSSNIGGALLRAGGEFTRDPDTQRDEALWIVIMLAGGPANATDVPPGHDPNDPSDPFRFGYCPDTTWDQVTNPFCRDADADSRHGDGDTDYDADDYARDQADFVADPDDGQGITIFTIGLGRLNREASLGDPDAGEALLSYAATEAGDSDVITEPDANHGLYFYAPSAAELDEIFEAIAANIFTRITQ